MDAAGAGVVARIHKLEAGEGDLVVPEGPEDWLALDAVRIGAKEAMDLLAFQLLS